MNKLFTYGTLQDEAIQKMLFNKTLKGKKDSIIGFEKKEIELNGVVYPILVRNPKSTEKIIGTCYDLSEEDLKICDAYEGEEYKRVIVVLNSKNSSWVYVSN